MLNKLKRVCNICIYSLILLSIFTRCNDRQMNIPKSGLSFINYNKDTSKANCYSMNIQYPISSGISSKFPVLVCDIPICIESGGNAYSQGIRVFDFYKEDLLDSILLKDKNRDYYLYSHPVDSFFSEISNQKLYTFKAVGTGNFINMPSFIFTEFKIILSENYDFYGIYLELNKSEIFKESINAKILYPFGEVGNLSYMDSVEIKYYSLTEKEFIKVINDSLPLYFR